MPLNFPALGNLSELIYISLKYLFTDNIKSFSNKWLYVVGIHAREWISPAAVSYIISELVENRHAHISDIQGIDFYILPLMNPDGYEFSHKKNRLWRKNRSNNFGFRGTDLNRNWGYMWGGVGVSHKPWKETYAGPGPFSEPETRAVSSFIRRHSNNIKVCMNFKYFAVTSKSG